MKILPIAAASALVGLTGSCFAMNVDRYTSIVGKTIAQVDSGTVDVDQLIGLQQELIAIGVEGAREFGDAAPEHAAMMNFVAESAPNMVSMNLDEIEEQWHDGLALAEIGVDFDALDHFGPAISHMDAVLHPATAIIALREYRTTGDAAYLEQVKDELSEVVEHLAHISN